MAKAIAALALAGALGATNRPIVRSVHRYFANHKQPFQCVGESPAQANLGLEARQS
ncbi:hypothetical protein TSMEX_011134, partial [Taenia solium]